MGYIVLFLANQIRDIFRVNDNVYYLLIGSEIMSKFDSN